MNFATYFALKTHWNTRVISLVQAGIRNYSVQPTLDPKTEECSSFKYSDLQLSLTCPEKRQAKPDLSNPSLEFGKYFTDHILEIDWAKDKGWSRPAILPFHNLQIHPAAKVFHYSVEVFEGMKAYRGVDGKIRLFRPDLNLTRLHEGALRLLLPSFEPREFLDCLKHFIRIEEEWVPPAEISSLYIRPTFIGTEPLLGVSMTMEALLYVILCSAGSYFGAETKAISLLADPQYVRSWPGGCGDKKLGSNYGPSLLVQKNANDAGHENVLWLYGDDHEITEAGTTNVFMFIQNSNGDKELVTAPLNGLILPGVTRQSILDLTREWREFKVSERAITMKELVYLINEKRLLEMFCTGTAAVVCPVCSVEYLGKIFRLPSTEHENPIHLRILNHLTDIYYGRISHQWGVVVN